MYQKILVPYDGSPPSDRAIDEAVALAKLTHGQLRLFHLVDEISVAMASGFGSAAMGSVGAYSGELIETVRLIGKQLLEKAEARVRAAGVECSTVLLDSFQGELSDRVVEQAEAWGAELIVLGSHGRRGVARLFMGSGAESVLRVSPVPVLLVRATEPPARKA